MSREEEQVREGAPPTEQETSVEEPAPAAPAPVADQQAPAGPERHERPADTSERPQRRFRRRKVCAFCVENVQAIDYKDPGKLRRYLSDRGRIDPRRKTGTCAKHQRWLSVALKRARHLALLPYTPEHIRLSGMFTPRR